MVADGRMCGKNCEWVVQLRVFQRYRTITVHSCRIREAGALRAVQVRGMWPRWSGGEE